MASRLTLALQYSSILWHTRSFKSSRLPLALMIAANFVAGMIYLGLGFAFTGSNTGLFAVWFVLAAVESLFAFAVGLHWKVMSFMKTHLVPRISLLTFIFIGEGVVAVCLSVTRIVGADSPFTSPTIGNITAGVANLYMIYMMYFDWRRSLQLGEYMQLIWCNLHYPFLLACKLFIEGSSQFVIWWKAFEEMAGLESRLEQDFAGLDSKFAELYNPAANITMGVILGDTLNGTVHAFYTQYRPKFYHTILDSNTFIDLIRALPDSYFTDNTDDLAEYGHYESSLIDVATNSLFATFKIQDFSNFDITDDSKFDETNQKVLVTTFNKFNIVVREPYLAMFSMLCLRLTSLDIVQFWFYCRWHHVDFDEHALHPRPTAKVDAIQHCSQDFQLFHRHWHVSGTAH